MNNKDLKTNWVALEAMTDEDIDLSESSIEPWIKVMFLFAVAGAAKGLQVADVVTAAVGQGDDVIDRQFSGLSTA